MAHFAAAQSEPNTKKPNQMLAAKPALPTGQGGQQSERPSECRAQPSPPGEASGARGKAEPAPARGTYKFFFLHLWIIFGNIIGTVR